MSRLRSRGLGSILRDSIQNIIKNWNSNKEKTVKKLLGGMVNDTYKSLNELGKKYDKIEVDCENRLVSVDGGEFKDMKDIQKEFGTSEKNMIIIKLALFKLNKEKRKKCTIQLKKEGMPDSMVTIDDQPPLAFHYQAMSRQNQPIDQKKLQHNAELLKEFQQTQLPSGQ